MAKPTAGNPSGGYDIPFLRNAIAEQRKLGRTDDEIARDLLDHPTVGPKLVAAGKRGESSTAALALVGGDYASYGKLTDKGEYSPTAGMEPWQKAVAGVGKSFTDAAKSVRSFVASPFVGQEKRDEWQREAAATKSADEPLMDTWEGRAGNIVGDMALTSVPGIGAQAAVLRALPTVARAAGGLNLAARAGRAGAGAAAGGAGTVPFTVGDKPLNTLEDYLSALGGGAYEGVVGDVAARGIGRVIKPLRFDVDPEHAARIRRLENVGMNRKTPQNKGYGEFDLAQLTQDPTLIDLKSSLAKLPGFSSTVKQYENAALGDFTQAATAHTGTPVRSVGHQGMSDMNDALLRRDAEFMQGPRVPLGPQYVGEMRAIKGQYATPTSLAGLSSDTMRPVDAGLNLARRGRTVISAEDAIRSRRALSNTAHDLYQSNQSIRGDVTRDAQEALDNAIRSSFDNASPGMGNAWDAYRRNTGAFLDVSKAAGSPGGITDSSALNPKALAAAVRGNQGRTRFATGQAGELGMLADDASRVLMSATPNSGTPQRSLYSLLLLQGPEALTNLAAEGGLTGRLARMTLGPAFAKHMLYGGGPFGKKHMLEGAFGPESDAIIKLLLESTPGLYAGMNED